MGIGFHVSRAHIPCIHVVWTISCTRSFCLLRESTESGYLVLNLNLNLNLNSHQPHATSIFKIQSEDFFQPLFVFFLFCILPVQEKITISSRETPLISRETRDIEHPGITDTIGSGPNCSARQVCCREVRLTPNRHTVRCLVSKGSDRAGTQLRSGKYVSSNTQTGADISNSSLLRSMNRPHVPGMHSIRCTPHRGDYLEGLPSVRACNSCFSLLVLRVRFIARPVVVGCTPGLNERSEVNYRWARSRMFHSSWMASCGLSSLTI